MILHEQDRDLSSIICNFQNHLRLLGYDNMTIHTGPLVRRESVYLYDSILTRKKLFNALYNAVRKMPVHYICSKVKKAECPDSEALSAKLSQAIAKEIRNHYAYWISFDKIIVYYDNGQNELKRILNIIFNSLFSNVEFRKVRPSDYILFQAADLICTLVLVEEKFSSGNASRSELEFFENWRMFKREYWRKIEKMHL